MLGVGHHGPLGRVEGEVSGGWSAAGARAMSERAADSRERDAWVVLGGVEGVGPVSFERLIAAFGSAVEVLRAARAPGSRARLVAATRSADGGSPALAPAAADALVAAALAPERTLEPVRRSGVGIITLADDDYPSRLRSVDLPPPVLFLRGSAAALDTTRAVAIVGTRRPTQDGRSIAGRIADAVAGEGAALISGLALGIDAVVHEAAVRFGTPTVAVIGGGHERLYPSAHRGLAAAIVRGGGAVVSEFAPLTAPSRGTFPRRNRIISGLADATVVVEAGARSGALTTAAWALEQGRSLHLVPGRPGDPTVAGSLAFLREAGPEARVVVGVPELLEDLGLARVGLARAAAGRLPGGLTQVEADIAERLAASAATLDELVTATGAPPATVLGALTRLEGHGLVVDVFGRYRAAGALASAGRPAARLPRVGRMPGGTPGTPGGEGGGLAA